MQNIKGNGRIYLSGGGNEKQSFPLDKFFFDTLPKSGRFLYIPVALRGHTLYSTAHLWMKGVTDLHERKDVQFETVDDLAKYTSGALNEFDGVYIGGGNTWNLIQELSETGFSDTLIQYIKTGGQVYGGSAGAIIMGKKINTHDDKNNTNLQSVFGFNLLKDFSVACHFKDEQSGRFKAWAVENNLPIVCLPEEAGLVVEKGIAVCAGTKSCIVYLADGTSREIGPKESFDL